MATFNKFNAFAAAMPNGGVNLGSDTIKILLTNTAPVATNSIYSDISTNEVASGNGYTTGGATVTLTSSTQSSGTYKYIASAANPTWTATGAMGTFRYAVIYDTTPASNKYLIGWWDYGSALSLTTGQTFTVSLDGTNGVFQLA
jgi:hypothetical protein